MSERRLTRDLEEILGRMPGMWEELRGGRVFITGGTGFFGCWLLESFLWANEKLGLGAKAVVLTRDAGAFGRKRPELAGNSAIDFHEGDVRKFAFPEGAFTHVIHAASDFTGGVMETNPLSVIDTIIEGTRRVLELARVSGAKKFLLTSSGAVYGRQPADVTHIAEDFPGAPDVGHYRSAYGEAKRLAELQCAIYAKQFGLEPKIARCFAFVGPYLPMEGGYAIGNFIRDALAGGPIQIAGDGSPWRSYLYAGDLAAWLWTILFKAPPCRPYNVGSDEALTIEQTARQVAKALGGEMEVTIAKKRARGALAERYVPVINRAQDELGLEVWTSLEEAIRRTAEFNRDRNK